MSSSRAVLMVCDAGSSVGIGHVMRCIALGEEFSARGFEVRFAADLAELPWVAAQLANRGMGVLADVHPAAGAGALLSAVGRLQPAVLVIDSYLLPAAAYAEAHATLGPGQVLLALTDGDPGGRAADVYLDQNIGAEADRWALAPGSERLAGLRFALMREEILTHRPSDPGAHRDRHPPRVLAFFGGTDAYGAAPVVTAALVATGAPFAATVVAASARSREAVEAVPLGPGQSVEVIGPSDRLAELVTGADVVVSAAGTSSWELCCLGAAAALVCVADNQRDAYGRAVALDLVTGLGELADLSGLDTAATARLARLLREPGERARLREAAWRLVDGAGRRRVVDAVLVRTAGEQ